MKTKQLQKGIEQLMEGNSYASAVELVAAIVAKFGADARFHTCSGAEMDAAQLVAFFEAKGKFMPTIISKFWATETKWYS